MQTNDILLSCITMVTNNLKHTSLLLLGEFSDITLFEIFKRQLIKSLFHLFHITNAFVNLVLSNIFSIPFFSFCQFVRGYFVCYKMLPTNEDNKFLLLIYPERSWCPNLSVDASCCIRTKGTFTEFEKLFYKKCTKI